MLLPHFNVHHHTVLPLLGKIQRKYAVIVRPTYRGICETYRLP